MTREDIHKKCRSDGIGIMEDIFDIILDRGEVTVEQVMTFLDGDGHDPIACYEDFVVRGINKLEDVIKTEAM